MTLKRALLTALLLRASVLPAEANDALHHWLHACDNPQLEYWQELCSRSRDAQAAPPSVQAPSMPPQQQSAAQTHAPQSKAAGIDQPKERP